jgi:hypothetical protein
MMVFRTTPMRRPALTTEDAEDTEEGQKQKRSKVRTRNWRTIDQSWNKRQRVTNSHFAFHAKLLFLVLFFLRVLCVLRGECSDLEHG